MLATQSLSSSSRIMRSNFMDALRSSKSEASAPEGLISSPESHAAEEDGGGFTIEMSDIMLPASALESELFGIPPESSATVVSTASDTSEDESPVGTAITTSRSKRKSSSSAASERRHSLPSSLMLAQSPLGEAVTQPVPEFLCHLFSMLRDPSYSDLISWAVPNQDEPDHMGGGIRGIGKIVVQKPEALQDFVLGKYYRHSKYASFQRQLNYFGFKKRLHGGKKGKLSPCSYIHDSLTDDVGSLFTLKRRPPAKKRASLEDGDIDSSDIVSVTEDRSVSTKSTSSSKRRRLSTEKKSKKSKKEGGKKNKKKQNKQQGKQQVVVSSVPLQVQAEEFGPPTQQSSSAVQVQIQVQTAPSMIKPMLQVCAPSVPCNPAVSQKQLDSTASSSEASQPTLLELLSTSLPPSDILFSDDVDSVDDQGIPAWVTDDGKYHYHNVDSSLIDLAMIY